MSNQHEFAFYLEDLKESIKPNEVITISDEQLYHRIIRVLRLTENESLIFFNHQIHIFVKILSIEKKRFSVIVTKKEKNQILFPKITVMLCILKRENFEQALYSCVELGANAIQPIISQKVQNKKWTEKEEDRYKSIIISAAEQSKNYAYPNLLKPIELDNISKTLSKDETNIFFDVSGKPLLDVINKIKEANPTSINLLVGPEGDLTDQEKESLKNKNFEFCLLTPTVLRSLQAVAVGLGVFRSIFNK